MENKAKKDMPVGMTDEDIKKQLTPEQYNITRQGGTEAPFQNEYWNNHKDGIYVDLITGKPLFSSLDKYDSGTGWPSFTKTIDGDAVLTQTDKSIPLMTRTEVISKDSGSHLGHVFDDGPPDAGGKRFCMNSGAMKFIPKEKLKGTKYEKYLKLFEKKP